ncbi:MAG: hypothetical protein IPF55_13325 [Rhodoferax sp.]|nr:hypothetical protein [Rhodoferax sp.]
MIESRDSDETIEAFLQERILVLQRIVQVSEGEFRQAELDSLMTGWLKDVGRGRLAS